MNISGLLSSLNASSENSGGLAAAKNAAKNFPVGGLAGGAMAGGLVALLLGNKSVRKTATTAAKFGGAAVLGGLAYKAYRNWQISSGSANHRAFRNRQ